MQCKQFPQVFHFVQAVLIRDHESVFNTTLNGFRVDPSNSMRYQHGENVLMGFSGVPGREKC